MEEAFLEIKSFCTNSTAHFPPLAILKENHVFFPKKTQIFQKPNFRKFSEILLTISVTFYGKFASLWWLKISSSESLFCLAAHAHSDSDIFNSQVIIKKMFALSG